MDATPENSTLQIKDPESQSSWVPSTPAKPALVKVQSTYTEKQEQPLQVNWSQQTLPCEGNALDERRIEGIAIGFPQEIEVQNVARCCGESNLVTVDRNSDNCEATAAENTQFYADTVSIYNEFSMENASNVPFKELLALADAAKEFLALADAAGTAKSPEKASNHTALNAESRSSALEFTHFQTTSTSTSSSLENQGHSLESRLYSVPVTPNRGIAGFSGLSFDLNSPPRTLADTGSSAGISSQFAPITPDQVQKTDKEKVSSMPDLCTGGAAKETDVQKEVIMIAELSEPQNDQAQLVENQSCATISSVIGENFKPEMGSDQQRDTSKTPLQKSRRRKHRPKVVVEGQSRTSRNPRTSKPAGPEEVVTPKRKYVRKNTISKPVDTPLEGNTNGIDAGAKSPGSEALPKTKRKYVRRKVVEQSTTPLEKNAKPTDSMAAQVTQRSCKKSLNFDFESQVPDERSTQATTDLNAKSHSQVSIPQDQSTSTMNLVQEMEVMVEKKEADIAYDLTKSMNHALEGYLVVKESQARCSSTSFMSNQLHDKSVVGNQNHCTSGKCQIVFSDATHDKEASIFRIITSDARCATRSSSKSNCSSSACLTQETQARGSKRRQFSTNDESESCSINAAGAQYNSLQAYQDIFPQNEYNREGTPNMHFPAIFKKKRTETMYKSETSSMLPTSSTTNNYGRHGAYHCNDTQKKDFTSEITFRITAAHCDACSRPTTADCTQAEPISKCLPTLRNAETPTKKRSKGPIRVRDFASLHEFSWQMPTSSRRGMPSSRVLQEAHTCMDALVTDTRARLTTKKRSKRNYVASASPNTYNPYQSATMLMGPPPTIMWKNTSSIDAIVEQFNCLDIKAKCNQFSSPEQNALVTYQVDYPWQNSIVVYQSNGTMVPFDAPFNHMRKRRPRPKVDLDDETNRVWKLLLEDINNDGIDGTDQQKAKWWEEERQVFRGRTNSFIARMHLVQGDRRFTPWKGSVLDSVIGVFLTQNVSDHLSSSAFISMAARFPLESSSHHHHTQSCEKRITKGPEVSDPDDQKVSSQLACLQDSITLGDKKYTGEEVIDAKDIFGNTSEDTKITKNSKSPSSDASEYGPKLYNEPDVNKFDYWNNETLANFNGDQRESDDVISSQNSVVSSHNSADSTEQTANKTESCSQSSTETEPTNGVCGSTSFVKLLQMAETTMLHGVYNQGRRKRSSNIENPTNSECMACNSICVNSGYQEARDFDPSEDNRYCDLSKENELSVTEQSGLSAESSAGASYQNMVVVNLEEVQKLSSENNNCLNSRPVKDLEIGQESNAANSSECILSVTGRIDVTNETRNQKIVESNLTNCSNLAENEMNPSASKSTRGRNGKEKKNAVDWDKLRKQAFATGKRRERTANTMDSVDWEAVRCANVEEIAQTIKERGMNNMLAERIKDFLNRIVKDHGSIDLEWLRDVPPDSAKEFLLSVRGLGLKSVECVRLLTLHHLAFPVDTNVGRIAVRLGWVPLQPLPESLQLHLLELYPVLESIQKYLWPRLCKLDQRTLYELHYQMITFGKVFCTKSKPNCNSCPMRGECRHFASAFASARLALPAPEEKSIVSVTETKAANRNRAEKINHLQLPLPQASQQLEARSQVRTSSPIIEEPATPEPIVEVPATPEPEQTQVPEMDIEDFFCDDADEIPTIKLNMEELNQNLQNYIETNVLVQEGEMSKALVVLTPEAASIPTPKLKNISQLRTEHQVYELPDTHPLLAEFDRREPDDPSSYLLAIWTPGETVDSIQPPERRCSFQESGKLCDQETCFSCSSIREANSQTVRGTLLIPCRTAMRGSFPLNGTYFQVNEMFADYESSLNPIDVPRGWLWNLRRRTVYFGTSIPTIFKGLSQGEIQYCFWRGFVCVRGFDRKIRAPRPLVARLHFPASKRRGRTYES